MTVLIVGDSLEYVPLQDAGVPAEPSAWLLHPMFCQVSAIHTLPEYSSLCKGWIFLLSEILLFIEWKSFSCSKINALK